MSAPSAAVPIRDFPSRRTPRIDRATAVWQRNEHGVDIRALSQCAGTGAVTFALRRPADFPYAERQHFHDNEGSHHGGVILASPTNRMRRHRCDDCLQPWTRHYLGDQRAHSGRGPAADARLGRIPRRDARAVRAVLPRHSSERSCLTTKTSVMMRQQCAGKLGSAEPPGRKPGQRGATGALDQIRAT